MNLIFRKGLLVLVCMFSILLLDAKVPYTLDATSTTAFRIETNDLNQGKKVKIRITGDASNGQLIVNEDFSISYVPEKGFSGNDSFSYLVCTQSLPVSYKEVEVKLNLQANSLSEMPQISNAVKVIDGEETAVQLSLVE